jgi:putative membrane protein
MISDADRARIGEAIRQAEAKTSGEIYCVVAQVSGDYRLVPLAWASLVALMLPLPLLYLTQFATHEIYLAQLAAFLLAVIVFSVPSVRMALVSRRVRHQFAHAQAMQQFLSHGIQNTQARTGVLIFASAAERYAEIVADAGINSKVTQAVWDDAIAALIAAIKDGRPGDGFVAAIEKCGAVLAQHFPPGALNPDELPNKLVVI